MKNKKTLIISSVIVAGFVALYDYKFILSVLLFGALIGLTVLTVAEIGYAYKNIKPKKNKKNI